MGLSAVTFEIATEFSRGADRLLCLGTPDIYIKPESFGSEIERGERFVSSRSVFKSVGVRDVVTINVWQEYPEDIIADLCNPIPIDLACKFDRVLDHGTIEHCYNPVAALWFASRAVKPGGSILHLSGLDGWKGHGFFQIQAEWFFTFYCSLGWIVEANGEVNDMPQGVTYVGRFKRPEMEHELKPWIQGKYGNKIAKAKV